MTVSDEPQSLERYYLHLFYLKAIVSKEDGSWACGIGVGTHPRFLFKFKSQTGSLFIPSLWFPSPLFYRANKALTAGYVKQKTVCFEN